MVEDERVVAVGYSVDGSGPDVGLAVVFAERCRLALMSQFGRANGSAVSIVLAGKNSSGKPLQGHNHAFYLPYDADGDGRTERLAVYASMGLGSRELDAAIRLEEVSLGPEHDPVRLRAAGAFDRAGLDRLWPGFASSVQWVSYSPYVMSRHPKFTRAGAPKLGPDGTQLDSPENQLKAEWRQRMRDDPSLPPLVGLQLCGREEGQVDWNGYRLSRLKAVEPAPIQRGLAFRLTFAAAVRGPIALGYGCHFGLGMFVPASDSGDRCS